MPKITEMINVQPFRKILVANRGEIAIRIFRACTELNIRTVAIYSEEDDISLHRFKADEAYLVGKGKTPIEAYLDIEGILDIAKEHEVDAIHPGYGFLAENPTFARRCEEEGITFIGPSHEQILLFGDKLKARQAAIEAGIPVVPGTIEPIQDIEEATIFAKEHGFPIIVKASSGGGGRGMRIVTSQEELAEAISRASSEASLAFGNPEVYIEKYIENPKHIEVQILADQQGHVVHLYERDCSVQRRHQKVVEVAPALNLSEELKNQMYEASVHLMRKTGYVNAGTVEFLVTPDDKFYFIEVNPRIQVEHTISEIITGIDIVQSQIRIAEGYSLHSEEVGIPLQSAIDKRGFAIQCRITTEDPENNFAPDTGRIITYRSASGLGVRLDAGNSFAGSEITPHYDSLIVKVSTYANTFEQASRKMNRTLQEFRIRGVKTNILFLENVVQHPKFLNGDYDTSFLDRHPELFRLPKRQDRATKVLSYIGHVTVNGFEGLPKRERKPVFPSPRMPEHSPKEPFPNGTKQLLDELGAEGLSQWILEQKKVLLTDTTLRDAHQSLFATRMRTYDMLRIADSIGKLTPDLFSLEMWGGATFDTSMRFLKEDPWERLHLLRKKVPNILFQMLLRGANAVGYTNYPDNIIQSFIQESAKAGIDLFRIFDSLNWLDGMKLSIDTVRNTGKIAEAAICYTGDILDPTRNKYTLQYYVNLAKELEKAGAHIIGIKDMAGLLKPYAAYQLVKALKEEVGLPIHLHTHDTSGNGQATLLKAIEAGVDIVDTAMSSMSGLTSQPSLNGLVAALQYSDRDTGLQLETLEKINQYWEDVRPYYACFESGLKASSSEVYQHEMPGGQYTNLKQQANSVGLRDRFEEVKAMYAKVNQLFGDLVKVTPSSKVVGDMALFMVQNHLTEEDIYEKGDQINFPDSVVQFFQGYLGQPYGGFPERLREIILKGREYLTCRPGTLLPSIDLESLKVELAGKMKREPSPEDLLSYALYPKVFLEKEDFNREYGNVAILDTPTFFHGMRPGEKLAVEIEKGKTLMIKLTSIGELNSNGTRTIYFELNGVPREIKVRDHSVSSLLQTKIKADKQNPLHIGATMPGKVIKVFVNEGDQVKKGEYLIVTEAMKMETTIQSSFDGTIKEIHVKQGDSIEAGDLLIEFE